MEINTKNIKIIFSQKKFNKYLDKKNIDINKLSINEIKTIIHDISHDFIIGKISLDMWSGMAGKLYWIIIQHGLETEDVELSSVIETISDLGFYLRQIKNNQTSKKLEEIYQYISSNV